MSYKISAHVWEGARQKSGNLLVLLAIADHASDHGDAWPGVPLLARKTRLSERHVRRCVRALVSSSELEILAEPAPGGGPWYQIRIDRMAPDNLSSWPPTTRDGTSMSNTTDAGAPPYIREPATKPSIEPASSKSSDVFNPSISSSKKNKPRRPVSLEFFSAPKNGF
jgi:hypothetical protein